MSTRNHNIDNSSSSLSSQVPKSDFNCLTRSPSPIVGSVAFSDPSDDSDVEVVKIETRCVLHHLDQIFSDV